MFQLTEQEKKVILFICLVMSGGTVMELSFKLLPSWRKAFSIIGDDSFYPKVNVNAASLDELVAIPHIGPATAKRIVAARDAGGPFSSSVDLSRAGLGEGTVRRVGKYLKFR